MSASADVSFVSLVLSLYITAERTHGVCVPSSRLMSSLEKCETGLLRPKYGCKRAREKYSFDGGKSDQTFRECRSLAVDPLESPVSLALDAIFVLSGVFINNVSINTFPSECFPSLFESRRSTEPRRLVPHSKSAQGGSRTIPSEAAKKAR